MKQTLFYLKLHFELGTQQVVDQSHKFEAVLQALQRASDDSDDILDSAKGTFIEVDEHWEGLLMFSQYFYNKHLRNTVIAFGTIFNTMGKKI